MSPLFRRLAEVILFLKWPLFLVFTLVTLLFGFAVPQLKIDPSTEALFAKNTPEYQFYQDFRKHFGSDHLIAVAIETSDYLTLTNLRWTQALTTILSSDARVDRVTSLTNAMDVRHKVLGVKVEPVIEGVLEGEKPIEELKKEALVNPFLLGNLLSKDGRVGAILIRLKAKPEDPTFLQGYVGDLRHLLDSFPWPGAHFYVAGSPVEQNDFIVAIRRDQMFFIPAVALFLILASFFIYRNIPSVVVAMSIVFVTLIWTFGTIALLGRSLNLINSLLAPVVMIISIPNAIYLINLFSELRPHHPGVRESISLTLQHLGIPCLLTSATIMVGFLSLTLNPVPAVQDFGLFASLGTGYAYLISMTLTPLLLPILPFQRGLKMSDDGHFFNRVVISYLERIEFHIKWVLVIGTVLLMAVSVMGIKKIRVDTNLIRDLRADSPIAVASRFIDKNLTGVYSLGISIARQDSEPLLTVVTLQKLDELAQFLETQPEIAKVNSLAMIIKKIHEARVGEASAFRIPDEEGTLQDYLSRMAESDNPDFWTFVSRDFKRMRLEARMRAVGTQRGRVLEDRIWKHVAQRFGDKYEVKITGSVSLLGQMSERLVSNQMESLGVAFVVILGLISIFFRSLKMGMLAAIPNLIPMVALFGLMGFLKIELSTPTAMISTVVLGIVVDASIQFLYRFRHEFDERRHYLQALHHTYRNVGQAMVVSTLILVFGFSTSAFASFRPTVYFGLLTGATILIALICTLVLLPVVLVLLKPFGPQETFSRDSKEGYLKHLNSLRPKGALKG